MYNILIIIHPCRSHEQFFRKHKRMANFLNFPYCRNVNLSRMADKLSKGSNSNTFKNGSIAVYEKNVGSFPMFKF